MGIESLSALLSDGLVANGKRQEKYHRHDTKENRDTPNPVGQCPVYFFSQGILPVFIYQYFPNELPVARN